MELEFKVWAYCKTCKDHFFSTLNLGDVEDADRNGRFERAHTTGICQCGKFSVVSFNGTVLRASEKYMEEQPQRLLDLAKDSALKKLGDTLI
jgi:hypothetical protein